MDWNQLERLVAVRATGAWPTHAGRQPRGIRRLAAAMLIQAALDIRSLRQRPEVVSWMRDESHADLSFVFCCHVLGRDPDQVRCLLEQGAGWWLAEVRRLECQLGSFEQFGCAGLDSSDKGPDPFQTLTPRD